MFLFFTFSLLWSFQCIFKFNIDALHILQLIYESVQTPCSPFHKITGTYNPGSKMTISGRPEIGLEDVPWTLAAHRFDLLRTSFDPKMVQILTEIFKTILKAIAPFVCAHPRCAA